jgi:hypothetical protein
MSHLPHLVKETNSGAQRIGLPNRKTVEIPVLVRGDTVATIEVQPPHWLTLDQYQAYGAGAASSFAYQHGEDEASFSVVDNRSVPKPRTYNRLGAANRGRGGAQRGGRGQLQKLGGRGGARGGAQGGRWGQGFRGRRFGWKDYDKPQRLRDASVTIKPEWKMLEEIEFSRLSKLTLKPVDGEDVYASLIARLTVGKLVDSCIHTTNRMTGSHLARQNLCNSLNGRHIILPPRMILSWNSSRRVMQPQFLLQIPFSV